MVECNFIWEYPDKKKREDIGEFYIGQFEMLEK